ncbi:ATP-binding protein [Streptomyces xanthophaeus]|uniref:ATP-binding protein n=1 Tax=Streptomyces xanthophaeus TaxID=67385 RepID=UPI00398FFCBE
MAQTITPLLTASTEWARRTGSPRSSDAWTATFVVGGHVSGEVAPADARQVGGIRKMASTWLNLLGLSYLHDDLLVIVSEIVTNAIEHAVDPHGGSVRVTQRLGGGHLSTEVRDSGHGQPQLAIAGHEEETGRGLYLVDNLTTGLGGTWGVDADQRTVWVEIPIPVDVP